MVHMPNLPVGSFLLLGYGIYLLLKAQFGKGYRGMTSGNWYPLKPSDRAIFRFAGVPLVFLAAFHWAGVSIGQNPALVVEAILGGALFATAFWYVEERVIKHRPSIEGPSPGASTEGGQTHAVERRHYVAHYVGPDGAVDPKKIQAALMLGDSYRQEGKYEKAIEIYQDALHADPSNAELPARIDQAKRRQLH